MIKSLTYKLILSHKIVEYLWVSRHIAIQGNEITDLIQKQLLTTSAKIVTVLSPVKIPTSNFLPVPLKTLKKSIGRLPIFFSPNYVF
jgi:hypothetical protein